MPNLPEYLRQYTNVQEIITGDPVTLEHFPNLTLEELNKINKRLSELTLEGGQPDTEGDQPSMNAPFGAADDVIDTLSLNMDISVQDAIDTANAKSTHRPPTTLEEVYDRNKALMTIEEQAKDILDWGWKAIGLTVPTMGLWTKLEELHPRVPRAEIQAALNAYNYYGPEYSKDKPERGFHDLPQPTDPRGTLGLSRPPSTISIEPPTVPMSQIDQARADATPDPAPVSSMTPSQQVGTMASAARTGVGETESPSSVGTGGTSEGGMSSDMGTSSHGGEGHGYLNTGGRVGALIQHLQTGGEADDADTNMEVANVPMGVVSDADGAPSPFSGGTGVEDDLEMEVDAGSYVLNAESVQLIGISDINEVIRDAYSIAVALGKEVPTDYDPQNKVPIRISNGEAVIPKALVDIIGLDKLEKWNKKGLQLRKQKEKMMAQQQQQQPPQQQQVASEAPMQQQMGQLMDRGGEVGDFDIPMSQREAQEALYPEEEIQKLQRLFRTDDSGPSKTGQPQSNINENITVEEEKEDIDANELQRLFRTDDSGPSKTGQPQSNINENITVEEEKNNVMAAQVGKIPVIPKSTFNRRKYTDNYDVVYGHDLYTPKLSKKKITRMTVKEIFANQDRLKKATEDETHTSTAHGPYQIIKPTLKSLMKNYKYDTNTLFTPAFQDNLATHLLDESGVFKFIEGEKDLNTVQNKLANIWAALPVSDEDKKSAHKNQKAALTSTEFREILKRVQELGETKGISLLLKTIRKAEAALR